MVSKPRSVEFGPATVVPYDLDRFATYPLKRNCPGESGDRRVNIDCAESVSQTGGTPIANCPNFVPPSVLEDDDNSTVRTSSLRLANDRESVISRYASIASGVASFGQSTPSFLAGVLHGASKRRQTRNRY